MCASFVAVAVSLKFKSRSDLSVSKRTHPLTPESLEQPKMLYSAAELRQVETNRLVVQWKTLLRMLDGPPDRCAIPPSRLEEQLIRVGRELAKRNHILTHPILFMNGLPGWS